MDLFNQLGELALGSRLKRLSDQVMRDGANIYKENNIDFEPRWFTVFYALTQKEPQGVTEIARELSLTHAAVSQTVRELLNKKLITAVKDKKDGRKRLLSLSNKGRELLPVIQPLWNDIAVAIHEMINEHQHSIIDSIQSVERSFKESKLHERTRSITQKRLLKNIKVVPYDESYKAYFRELNYAWIKKYFEVESMDQRILDDPDHFILEPGGTILFALFEGEVAGTCALIKQDDETFELAKMAVEERFQGLQIGKKLGIEAVRTAKKMGAKSLILESNKKLTRALNLYRRLGFVEVCTGHDKSLYHRANITMRLNFE